MAGSLLYLAFDQARNCVGDEVNWNVRYVHATVSESKRDVSLKLVGRMKVNASTNIIG